MPGIANMIDLIGKLDGAYVTVRQERCVLVRNRNADCLRCADACTSGCIHFDGECLSIEPERCIGCGTCVTACPTCCLEAHHPDDDRLFNDCLRAAEATQGVAVVACGELLDRAGALVDREKVVRVECLGRVEESLITGLVAAGVSDVVLVHGACAMCAHAPGRAMVERVLETERQLLETWGVQADVRLAAKLPAAVRVSDDGYDVARRTAFQQGGEEAVRMGAVVAGAVMADALGGGEAFDAGEAVGCDGAEWLGEGDNGAGLRYQKVMADGTLPHFVPDRRERLLDALASLGEPEDVMVDTRLWGHVVIDVDACDSCRMCAVFCPTAALRKFDRADGTFGVEHWPGDCVKCRTCTTICPTGALELSEEVFAVDLLQGAADAYEMRKPAVEKGKAHTIWHTAKLLTNVKEVYER